MTDFDKYALSKGISGNKMASYKGFLNGIISPTILEERSLNVVGYDIFSRLMQDKIIFLGTEIDDDVANIICSQLLYLNSVDDGSDIKIFINSPGGIVSAGLAIYDIMNYITPDVATYCMGTSASMAAVLLSSGTRGKRYTLPHSEIMIHQPSGGTGRVKSDEFEVAWKQMERCRDTLYTILSENMEKPVEEIEELCRLDKWYDAEEAVEAKIIDEIIRRA